MYDVSEVEGGDCRLIIKHNLRNVDTQPIKIQGKVTKHAIKILESVWAI